MGNPLRIDCDLDATGNWEDFRQDDNGNGTWDLDEQRTHNDANEITQIEGSSSLVSHDRAGNMTSMPKPSDLGNSISGKYDAWNRLVEVEDGEDTVAEYEYDGSNRRVVKDTYSGGELDETRHFYYTDQWQCIEERTESGGAIAANPDIQYVWGTRYVDNLILRDRDTTANGTLDERLYALQDANWNVTALAETDGTIIERYTYTAYGTLEVRDADFSPDGDGQSDQAWQYTYTTRRLDQETGLMYYRNRMYHPELGRFVSRDPVEYQSKILNLYCYADTAPIALVDPSGTQHDGYSPFPGFPPFYPDPDPQPSGPTADQQAVLACCDGDSACEAAMNRVFDILDTCPTKHWRPWPFATKNRCISWADSCYKKLEDAIENDPLLDGVIVWNHIYEYDGWVPTFSHHAFVQIDIGDCTFFADNALYGGSDDHIFMEIPDELSPEGAPDEPGPIIPPPMPPPYAPSPPFYPDY